MTDKQTDPAVVRQVGCAVLFMFTATWVAVLALVVRWLW